MGKSYRIKTELGINKSINFEFQQDFDYLEILSLKIQQEDVYTRSCAQYGVITGRVTANNGLGLPNARVSVFIPVDNEDKDNPVINQIYSYSVPSDKNEDGYRYNLLPHEKSYSTHAATGTFPSRNDVLTDSVANYIFEKYYKYTVKTNDSGDYMIFGVPVGTYTMVMDIDLSDIGEFSLTPQDLIRMGLATEAQVAGNQFKTSTDLNSLPQIVSITKQLEVSPLWGEPSICQIAINRVDFDLRDDVNIDIQPTSVFIGSIYSTTDKFRVRKNCRPKDNMGNLCGLIAGPGQILAIRQTIQEDTLGQPILEQYKLEQSGNIIDDSGTWLTELPMNLDYYYTDEFGNRKISLDPKIGVPTKAKYRFKIKWQQSQTLTEQTRRAYWLVPNIREYGWDALGHDDPTDSKNSITKQKQHGSYYFGLDWGGYTNPTAAINCEDSFYEFQFNRVYTISGLIDEWKKGGRGRFIGIKEIDNDDCSSSVNKFPVNDGFRNFDLLYFLFSIFFSFLQQTGVVILTIGNLILWIVSKLRKLLGKKTKANFRFKVPIITYSDCELCECQSDTASVVDDDGGNVLYGTFLSYVSEPKLYTEKLLTTIQERGYFGNADQQTILSLQLSEAIAGKAISSSSNWWKSKVPVSNAYTPAYTLSNASNFTQSINMYLTIGERVNKFNLRQKYFTGENKIKVTFAADDNQNFHYDNTLTVFTLTNYEPGQLLSFVNPEKSKDLNYLYTRTTSNSVTINGIIGVSKVNSGDTIKVTYCNPNSNRSGIDVNYILPYGSEVLTTKFASDIEYYQVITAITLNYQNLPSGGKQFLNPNFYGDKGFWSYLNNLGQNNEAGGNLIRSFKGYYDTDSCYLDGDPRFRLIALNEIGASDGVLKLSNHDFFTDFEKQYVTILQRGVDPYSPKYVNKYGIGKILGYDNEDDLIITAQTRLNIPIQPLKPYTQNTFTIQNHNKSDEIFYPSYFFTPGILGSTRPEEQYKNFFTNNVYYYSAQDRYHYPAANAYNYGLLQMGTGSNNYGYFIKPNDSSNQLGHPIQDSYYTPLLYNQHYYQNSDNLDGGAIMGYHWVRINTSVCYGFKTVVIPDVNNYGWDEYYFSPTLKKFAQPDLRIIQGQTILRTDRLPSSDYSDKYNLTIPGEDFSENVSLLQQNLSFAVYLISEDGDNQATTPSYANGATQVTQDVEGLPGAENLLSTLSNCSSMVSLSCYQGSGNSFKIKDNCETEDAIENGCYVFLRGLTGKFGKDLRTDIKSWSEWGFRFRFFYALCRGVLSQSFVNNWVNGSLYSFPFQVDTKYYETTNTPYSVFCDRLIYFDKQTNNFYYRSSPYSTISNNFVGAPNSDTHSSNNKQLLFPTTIINLGMKNSFYGEISFDPTTSAFVVDKLNDTSYSDTSDLVNLFVISRICDEGFLGRVFGSFSNNNNINQLFSRGDYFMRRIDGDLAQAFSINSEIGNIPFSPEFYDVTGNPSDPVVLLGFPSSNPTMGVFFSSTTSDLQIKDYLTPGIINFRQTINSPSVATYPFNIKTQKVPFYQWNLATTTSIFGSEINEWATYRTDIFSKGYQALDRRTLYPFQTGSASYFIGSNTLVDDRRARGYIYSEDNVGNYSINNGGIFPKKFLTGAPFQFYFGIVKGNSALDKFKSKYLNNE